MNLTFTQKLVGSFAVLILLLLLANGAMFLLNRAKDRAVARSRQLALKVETAREFQYLTLQHVPIISSAIIMADVRELDQFAQLEEKHEDCSSRLVALLENQSERDAMARMEESDDELNTVLDGQLVPALQTGKSIAELRPLKQRVDELLNIVVGIVGEIEAQNLKELAAGKAAEKKLGQTVGFMQVATSLLALALSLLLAFLIVRGMTRQVGAIIAILERISSGDLTSRCIAQPGSANRRDELTRIALAADETSRRLSTVVERMKQAAEQLSSTSTHLAGSSDQARQDLGEVSSVLEGLQQSAGSMQHSAGGASISLQQNSSAVESVARDIEEIAAYAAQASAQGREGQNSAGAAVQLIDRAAGSVQQTAGIVKELGEKTRQISGFINIITGIADQTNLLALNAAIEAARAGEAGRGFAVVAEEVRKLAEESNGAAGSITSLVHGIETEMAGALSAMEKSEGEVASGARTVGEASRMLAEIVSGIDALNDKIQAISSAAEEMNASTTEVLAVVQGVAGLADRNAGESSQASRAASVQAAEMQQISSDATALAELSGELQSIVALFKV